MILQDAALRAFIAILVLLSTVSSLVTLPNHEVTIDTNGVYNISHACDNFGDWFKLTYVTTIVECTTKTVTRTCSKTETP
jgi:hypothetical protein